MGAELCNVASETWLLEENADVSLMPVLSVAPAFYTSVLIRLLVVVGNLWQLNFFPFQKGYCKKKKKVLSEI